jgi:hypothetical protein
MSIEKEIVVRRDSIDVTDDSPTTSKRKRPVSPPREEVLADNPDIAVSSHAYTSRRHQSLAVSSPVVKQRVR